MSIVTKEELCGIFGVTERTITRWQKIGLPIETGGQRGTSNSYDTVKCVEWYARQEVEKAYTGPDGEFLDAEQELARLRHHQANKVALEEQLLSGKLLDAEEVQLSMGKLHAEIRSSILAMPSRLAPVLVKLRSVRDIRMALKSDVLKALEALSVGDDSDNSGTSTRGA